MWSVLASRLRLFAVALILLSVSLVGATESYGVTVTFNDPDTHGLLPYSNQNQDVQDRLSENAGPYGVSYTIQLSGENWNLVTLADVRLIVINFTYWISPVLSRDLDGTPVLDGDPVYQEATFDVNGAPHTAPAATVDENLSLIGTTVTIYDGGAILMGLVSVFFPYAKQGQTMNPDNDYEGVAQLGFNSFGGGGGGGGGGPVPEIPGGAQLPLMAGLGSLLFYLRKRFISAKH